jgi:hypothetical protein
MRNIVKIGLVANLIYSTSLVADPIQWKVEEGGNGHYYELVTTPALNWYEAKGYAEALGGYLVTITSEEENIWVYDKMGSNSIWLGGIDKEGNGIWTWITNEIWSYTSWNTDEPNSLGIENFLEYTGIPYKWNNHIPLISKRFIIEYDNSPFPLCGAATLSPDLELYIPRLEYKTAFGIVIPLQINMEYVPNEKEQLLFEVKDYEILSE